MSNVETFQHVGPRVAFGEVAISADEADQFRQIALKGNSIKELSVTDHETRISTTSYTSGLLSDVAADYNVYSSAFYSQSVAGSDPHYWRSVITFARFNDKNRGNKIYNAYQVESYQGEVVIAIRRVRITRILSRIAFNERGDPFEDVYAQQRKTFETPLTPMDIPLVDQKVERIMGRSRATGGR